MWASHATKLIAALGVLAMGCGAIARAQTTPVEAGADVEALPMLDPCPSQPDLQPKVPCTELGRVCEYNYGAAEPLCAGAQACLLDSGWQDTRNAHPCVNPCPSSPPTGSCGYTYNVAVCSYPDAGVDCVCAGCSPGKNLPKWSCFAPASVCAKRPELGTACSVPGMRCEYPPVCCGAFVQKCERGVWMKEQQQGCPP